MQTALDDPLSSEITERALVTLFAIASDAAAAIPQMAARAESLGAGEPAVAAASLAALVRGLHPRHGAEQVGLPCFLRPSRNTPSRESEQ